MHNTEYLGPESSISKEIDEMKRIAVVVMRKDRELVVEEDHHIPLS